MTVGTAPSGWPALVDVVEDFCRARRLPGFAQVGNAGRVPEAIEWARFVPHDRLQSLMREAALVVSHGGFGSLGDLLRNAHRVVVVPRRPRSRAERSLHPNDQWPVARRLAGLHGFSVCTLLDLPDTMAESLSGPPRHFVVPPSDIPLLVRDHLTEVVRAGGAAR
ncbi:MAG TPA: glycosyltransferase [Jiangellales bacterium]|nr:glycosyltransferase [Jiangellales bacterium]